MPNVISFEEALEATAGTSHTVGSRAPAKQRALAVPLFCDLVRNAPKSVMAAPVQVTRKRTFIQVVSYGRGHHACASLLTSDFPRTQSR